MSKKEISRREFIAIAALSAGALGFSQLPKELFPPVNGSTSSKKELFNERGIEILKTVEYEGIIKASTLPIIFIPLRKDYFYNERRDIEVWKVENISFGINKILYVKEDGNRAFRIATLHHNTGDHSLPIAILDEGQIDSATQEYWPTKRHGHLSQKKDVAGEFSLIGEYYPNKTHNLLEAAAQILRYQIKNGPFESNKTYSALDIIDLKNNRNFKYGKETYLGYGLRGGGICGMTTAILGFLNTYLWPS